MVMQIIYGGRQSGRTTRLIEMCAEAEKRGEVSYIVCMTHSNAFGIAQRAKELGLFISFSLTFEEFIRHDYYAHNITNLYIDNAELLLQYMCSSGVRLAGITITKQEDEISGD